MTAPRDAAASAGDSLTGAPSSQPGDDLRAIARRRRPFIKRERLTRSFIDPLRLRRILALALPIIAAMVSQSLLNVVDTAMVGGLGDAALAAVGLGSFVLFTCQAMILGLSVGVQAIAARRKGETAIGHRNDKHARSAEHMYGVSVNPTKTETRVYEPGDKIIVLAER